MTFLSEPILLNEARSAFGFFSSDSGVSLKLDEVDAAFKSLGFQVSSEILMKYIKEEKLDKTARIEFLQFVSLVDRVAGSGYTTAIEFFDEMAGPDNGGKISILTFISLLKYLNLDYTPLLGRVSESLDYHEYVRMYMGPGNNEGGLSLCMHQSSAPVLTESERYLIWLTVLGLL